MKLLRLALPFLCILVAASVLHAQTYTFATLAGLAGSRGTNDGPGNLARFNNPLGVAVDTMGNVYVADTENHTIRKITPEGIVSTFAGLAGVSGRTNGVGSEARFWMPQGLAVDSAGTVYVADSWNNTIRKITPAGAVSTLAGKLAYDSTGSTDGPGPDARFNNPHSVAVDGTGNVYVADMGNYIIRKITPTGMVSTLAGLAGSRGDTNGLGAEARFWQPEGVAVDSAGNVWVADAGNSTIRRITPDGMVTTPVGMAWSLGSVDGTGTSVRFYYPSGVAVDTADNVYIADTSNHTIRKITPALVVSTLAGLAHHPGTTNGTGADVRLWAPSAVAVDRAGNLYVAENQIHTIRRGQLGITPPSVGLSRFNNQLILSWPLAASNAVLEGASSLCFGATWTPLTNDNGISGDSLVHTNSLDAPSQFFRLRTP